MQTNLTPEQDRRGVWSRILMAWKGLSTQESTRGHGGPNTV